MFWQEGANGIRFLVLCTLITFCTSCHLELFEHPNFQKHSLDFYQSEEFEAKIVKGIKTHGSCSWQIFKQVYFLKRFVTISAYNPSFNLQPKRFH